VNRRCPPGSRLTFSAVSQTASAPAAPAASAAAPRPDRMQPEVREQHRQGQHGGPDVDLHDGQRADLLDQPGGVRRAAGQRDADQCQQHQRPGPGQAAAPPQAAPDDRRLPRREQQDRQRDRAVRRREVHRPVDADRVGRQPGEHRRRQQHRQRQVGPPRQPTAPPTVPRCIHGTLDTGRG
jgi:hypothetical protein